MRCLWFLFLGIFLYCIFFLLNLLILAFFLIFLYSQTKSVGIQKELRIIVNLTEFTSLALRFIFYSVSLLLWWTQTYSLLLLLLSFISTITWEIIFVEIFHPLHTTQKGNVKMLLEIELYSRRYIIIVCRWFFENNFHLFWNSNSLFVLSLNKKKRKKKRKIHFHVDSNKVCECLTYYLLMFIISLPEKISILPTIAWISIWYIHCELGVKLKLFNIAFDYWNLH